MFSRIAAGALFLCSLAGLPARAHSPYPLPAGDAALAESHTYALTFAVGE